MGTLSKEKDENDIPVYFSGDVKDWQPFKTSIGALADRKGYGWLFATGQALCDFYVSQIRKKTGTQSKKKSAQDKEEDPKEGTQVSTDVQAYKPETFDNWFKESDDKDDTGYSVITDVLLALGKNRLQTLGPNFERQAQSLGHEDEAAVQRAYKRVDIDYLKKANRAAVRILREAVYEHPRKETSGRRKLLAILETNEVKKILASSPLDDNGSTWPKRPWEIPAVQIWAKIMHKYESMQEALSGTFMEELASTIDCVTGDARERLTIYEADQRFERYGELLTKNFKDASTLWTFLRASLRQCHIRKLSKVGKDRHAWAKADEFLTELMDSDTMLTLENTSAAFKRAENYMQRHEDTEHKAAFVTDISETAETSLLAKVQEQADALQALQAKLDKVMPLDPTSPGSKRRRGQPGPTRSSCTYCKKGGHDESSCWQKQRDELDTKMKSSAERSAAWSEKQKNRKSTASEKRAYAAGILINKGPAAAAAGSSSEYYVPPTSSRPPAVRWPPRLDAYPSRKDLDGPLWRRRVLRVGFIPERVQDDAAFVTMPLSCLSVALDQRFKPHEDPAINAAVDSGAMLHVCGIRGPLGTGSRCQLTGVTGAPVTAERADVIFAVKTVTGTSFDVFMPDQALVIDQDAQPLLSLAVLLKAGFKATFAVGSKRDATYGGTLTTPDGSQIRLVFKDNMWLVPLCTAPTRSPSGGAPDRNVEDIEVLHSTVQTHPNVLDQDEETDDAVLSPENLPTDQTIQLVHDIWCHPGTTKLTHICKTRRGRGFPRDFLARLRNFKCTTCAVAKRTRRYRTSRRVKIKRASKMKRSPTPSTSRSPKPSSGSHTCSGCKRTFHDALSLSNHLAHSQKCPSSSQFRAPLMPVILGSDITMPATTAAAALHHVRALASHVPTNALNRLHIDFAHSISIGVNKEKYFLVMVFDGIDFLYSSASVRRTDPELLIAEFMKLTRVKIDCIRYDGAAEFAKDVNFQAFLRNENIAKEELPAYTHTLNARAEGAVRIVKEHIRCLLRRANLPRRFWPYAMLHFCRIYAYWPDSEGRSAWEKLDALGPHALCHDETRDLHQFGSYVTGHLPRTHPLVINETLDDRALEGVWLGNDLTTPTFWMYSFRTRKVVRLSDPRHFDHILPFLQPADIPHKIDLTAADICDMHAADGDVIDMPSRKSTRFRVTASGEPILLAPDARASDSGENSGEINSGEIDLGEPVQVESHAPGQPMLLADYKRLKHGKDVPSDAEIQYLKPQLLAQAVVYHGLTMDLPAGIWIDETTGKTDKCQVIATRAYSLTKDRFWYVDFSILSHANRADLQLPVKRGKAKSVNHSMNLIDLFRQQFNAPKTLEDLGITPERITRIMTAKVEAWKDTLKNPFALAYVITAKDKERKSKEREADEIRATATERIAVLDAMSRGPSTGHFKQVIPACELDLSPIFDEIDLLEGDPPHRGVAMRNARFRPYWIEAEEKEWQGLWNKGVFKKWDRKDLLRDDRVFSSRYVYKLKRSAATGEVYRFKARLIVRGFQMEKGVDYEDSFSPTPGMAVGRFMLALAVANDFELHACDIEQAFLQADKLPEGVNGRYFIQPPPGSPDAENKNIVYEVQRPLYGNPSSPRALHKTLDAYFRSEGFDHVGFEESVWMRPKGGKYNEDIYVSAHVDDLLICCKSVGLMTKFKQDLLTRFEGTDDGEVKEYLGCEVIRDRKARTGKLVQAGYAERVLRTFDMWDCNHALTPLDPNIRLSKRDSPEAIDPRLHRRMRSIVGCLSYLVNMTRPDLAFAYSQLSKFLQSPGPIHLAAAERTLAYLRGTYTEGITYFDPGPDSRNKLTGWVDSDFAADPDTRKSMTGYVFSLNGGAISWRSSRQGGVTLSSAEAEFVAASQAGQEAVYLRALLRGFNFHQTSATTIWEDNASCIMMSENPANRDRTRHVDTRVHYLRELVRDGHVKLLKCAGTQNVADALTKSVPRPALAKHRQYMWGTRVPFSAFYLSLKTGMPPLASYSIFSTSAPAA